MRCSPVTDAVVHLLQSGLQLAADCHAKSHRSVAPITVADIAITCHSIGFRLHGQFGMIIQIVISLMFVHIQLLQSPPDPFTTASLISLILILGGLSAYQRGDMAAADSPPLQRSQTVRMMGSSIPGGLLLRTQTQKQPLIRRAKSIYLRSNLYTQLGLIDSPVVGEMDPLLIEEQRRRRRLGTLMPRTSADFIAASASHSPLQSPLAYNNSPSSSLP